jgi:hypothetical protein
VDGFEGWKSVAMKDSCVASMGVAMCLAQSLVERLGCSTWGMLLVAVAEGRLWMVGLDECGSWWWRNYMVGNMIEVVCGSLMDTVTP